MSPCPLWQTDIFLHLPTLSLTSHSSVQSVNLFNLLWRVETSMIFIMCWKIFASSAKRNRFTSSPQDCFCRTFSQCAIGRFSWISWIDRWHVDSQQCSEPRPQSTQRKRPAADRTTTTSKRRCYAASACITGVNWLNTSIELDSILFCIG